MAPVPHPPPHHGSASSKPSHPILLRHSEPPQTPTEENPAVKQRSSASMRADVVLAGIQAMLPQPSLGDDAPCGSRFALAADETLADSEVAAVHTAFQRFQIPRSAEMFKDDLPDLMKYLGFPALAREKARVVADAATPYNEVDRDDVVGFVSQYAREAFSATRTMFNARRASDGPLVGWLRELMAALGFAPQRRTIEDPVCAGGGLSCQASIAGGMVERCRGRIKIGTVKANNREDVSEWGPGLAWNGD